jgi:hypothetical protein
LNNNNSCKASKQINHSLNDSSFKSKNSGTNRSTYNEINENCKNISALNNGLFNSSSASINTFNNRNEHSFSARSSSSLTTCTSSSSLSDIYNASRSNVKKQFSAGNYIFFFNLSCLIEFFALQFYVFFSV